MARLLASFFLWHFNQTAAKVFPPAGVVLRPKTAVQQMANEADTCRKHVVPLLQAAGWDDEPHSIAEQRTITDGLGQCLDLRDFADGWISWKHVRQPDSAALASDLSRLDHAAPVKGADRSRRLKVPRRVP